VGEGLIGSQTDATIDATAFKKNIYHFPFVILDLSLKKLGPIGFSSMTNLKLKMENDKCFS
jgi:hypothetical protein